MLESLGNNQFEYQRLSPEEQTSRGILGRLVGPIADFKKPTRNGRRYTEELWEQTFDNPIMKEKLENRCLFGELGHPADRSEVDMEKIAICMAERPKKANDGKLHSVFDILDTPNGRILKALCDYGCNIGVSSRGSGDTYEDFSSGEEVVDADSFECECWDAVLIPAVKEARMKYVNESYEGKKSLTEALKEIVEASNDNDKKIMTETLENLKLDADIDSSETQEEDLTDKEKEAGNAGDELFEQLKEALKEKDLLQKQVVTLQEKLSVSYTKEIKQEEKITSLGDTVKRLAESVQKSAALSKKLEAVEAQLKEQTDLAQERGAIIESYKTKMVSSSHARKSLKESLSTRDKEVDMLQRRVQELNESLKTTKRDNTQRIRSLEEELSALKMDSKAKGSQYAKKLANSNALVEQYRETASKAVERYIQSKAVNLGIDPNEIKNRLNENYSFDDIDKVCEGLRSYKRNMSKLPFAYSSRSVSKMTINEDTSSSKFTNPDDVVDNNLLDFLN